MRKLTPQQVRDEYGGILPPDAVIRTEAQQQPAPPPSMKPGRGRSRSGRFPDLNAFVDVSMSGLTGSELKVWLVLFRDTKADGTARTGQADIARRSGLSTRSVKSAIAELKQKGFIDIRRLGRLNSGPSVYVVRPVA